LSDYFEEEAGMTERDRRRRGLRLVVDNTK
jgi:hypothetical protein